MAPLTTWWAPFVLLRGRFKRAVLARSACLAELTGCVQAPELFSLPRKTHPMQFKNDPDAKTCDEKVDVWAIGVLVYELVYGQAPFACKVPMQTVNLIIKGFSGKFPEVVRVLCTLPLQLAHL